MALIGKIRNNSWLLIVFIGLGLGGFILMDMMSGQQSVFGGNQLVLGTVDGDKLDWNRFSRIENLLYRGSSVDPFTRRNALWNYFVEESVINKEAQAIGLGISKRELKDLQFGPNPSPIIQQRFIDPQTGALSREQLNYFKDQIENKQLTDPTQRAIWAHQEKEIIKEGLQNKLNALVAKSLYTPTWMAEMGDQDQNARVDFAYVMVPYSEVNNTDVSLADADFQRYIKENETRLNQDEEVRRVSYVTFDVNSTSADSAKWRAAIADNMAEFSTTDDDSAFVQRNYGMISANYFSKEDFPAVIADTLAVAAEGSVIGPFIAQGSVSEGKIEANQFGGIQPVIDNYYAYKAVKLFDRHLMADSADIRHILIRAATPEQFSDANRRIDSLKNLLDSGSATFDSLAIKFSEDPGSSSNGGLYENIAPNAFIPEFNDMLFVSGEVRRLYKIRSSLGYHLAEIMDRSNATTERYKVAYLSQPIVPTDETINLMFDQVNAFVGKNRSMEALREAVNNDPQLSIQTSNPVKANDFSLADLGTGQSSRDIIRWVFESNPGDVSPAVYSFQDQVNFYINKYVVAGVESMRKPGLPSVDDVRQDVELELIREKKGGVISDNIAGKSMEEVASEYSVDIDTLTGITFNQSFIQNLGNEPKVVAKAATLELGQTSAPIAGNSGVYLIEVVNKPGSLSAPAIPQARSQMTQKTSVQVNSQLIEALKNNAKIKDNRSRFY